MEAGWPDQCLLPGIPVGARLTSGSKIQPAMLGKIPGISRDGGETWAGMLGWSDKVPTAADLRAWDRLPTRQVCVQCRVYPWIDADIDDPEAARAILEAVADVMGWQAEAFQIRGRVQSPRWALATQTANGLQASPRWMPKLEIVKAGESVGALEWKAHGHVVAAGDHPRGDSYIWPNGVPETWALPIIEEDTLDRLRQAAGARLEALGYELRVAAGAGQSGGSSDPSRRRMEDLPQLLSVETLERLLASIESDPATVGLGGWDDGVRTYAHIGAVLGWVAWPEPPQCLLDFAAAYPGEIDGEAWLRERWASFEEIVPAVSGFLAWVQAVAAPEMAQEVIREVRRAQSREDFDDEPEEMEVAQPAPPQDAAGPELPRGVALLVRDGWKMALLGSKGWAVRREKSEGRSSVMRMVTKRELIDWYEPYSYPATRPNARGDAREVLVNPAREWWAHPGHQRYTGMDMYPPGGKPCPRNIINLWSGWGIQPAGHWRGAKRLLWHIRHVLCGNDRQAFLYFIHWLACVVQHPAMKPITAVFMQGGEGIGKGILGRLMMEIFGEHAAHIVNSEQILGRFNVGLEFCKFLFMDEAFFAADRRISGPLKALTTEPTILIERKFGDPETRVNIIAMLGATNEEHVVPASADARRFVILKGVSVWADDTAKRAYFKALLAEISAGGGAAFFNTLLQVNLKGWEMEAIPRNAALAEQKELSLRGPEAWWMGLLQDGVAPWGSERDPWPRRISKREVYGEYVRWSNAQRGEFRPAAVNAFWRKVKTMAGDVAAFTTVAGKTQRVAQLPLLADARKRMETFLRSEGVIDWEENEEAVNAWAGAKRPADDFNY